MPTSNELTGLELAQLVAERVMGWKFRNYQGPNTYPCIQMSREDGIIAVWRDSGGWYCWEPWRDPRAWWEIVEHFRTLWRTDDPEEMYWEFTDCQECGWVAAVRYSHHDGDVTLYTGEGETLGEAVMRAALATVS